MTVEIQFADERSFSLPDEIALLKAPSYVVHPELLGKIFSVRAGMRLGSPSFDLYYEGSHIVHIFQEELRYCEWMEAGKFRRLKSFI